MKRHARDLARLGGPPAFEQPRHVGRPHLGDRKALFRRLEEILDRRWLTNNGQCVQALEARVAEYLGVRHCVAVVNGTTALQVTARALGLAGEVIMPAFTFVATAHALAWMGLRPVFCDIDPRTHTLDPAEAERLITPATSAILGVHLWGQPCHVEALETLAARRGLPLIFDAAHAFGAGTGGRVIGGFGDAEVFSFHATKVLTTLEGGAVTTDDPVLADRLRLARNFGFTGLDRVEALGVNGKMNEFSAAMGLTSFESLARFIDANRRTWQAYREGLAGLPGIHPVAPDRSTPANYQYVVLEVDAGEAGLDRDALIDVLHAENVLARRYFWPGCHRMAPYRDAAGHEPRPLPRTARVAERVLVLPTGETVGPAGARTISNIIACALEHAPVLRKRAGNRSDDA